jgi:hypothetical protein
MGASADPWRYSFGVMSYLARAGYRLFRFDPTAIGPRLHSEPFRAELNKLGGSANFVHVRRPEIYRGHRRGCECIGADAANTPQSLDFPAVSAVETCPADRSLTLH